MTGVEPDALITFLAGCAPFDALSAGELSVLAGRARVGHYAAGEVVLDAFTRPALDVLAVISGRVDLWNDPDRIDETPDESLGPGGVFGFSAALTERAIGPRAVAVGPVTVARLPAELVGPVFSTPSGARFLAESVSAASRHHDRVVAYTTVDELIVRAPILVAPATTAGEAARLLTDTGAPCVVVRRPEGGFGLVTDALLRLSVLVRGDPLSTPVADLMDPAPAGVELGDSAAEALILLLERDAECVLVTDRAGALRGVVVARDFVVSSTTSGVALNEQLRRAGTAEELTERALRVPETLAELVTRGMASSKVITVHSAIIDTVVRRAVQLAFAAHPELSVDAFTWLSLGSNGRREAVLSSDIDAAVAFDDTLEQDEINRYRKVFVEINTVLTKAGLTSDDHGATAAHKIFARTNADWRAVGRQWLAHPEDGNGAMMTSLLVDGRPIHGDPGLPAVAQVFGELRAHPGTMRLLLRSSLATRARTRTLRDLLTGEDRFDLKEHALLPIVNLARWVALSAGSTALPTTERLRSAAGSPMLPELAARTLIEVFEVLQQLRLRHQLRQIADGDSPTDVIAMDRLSPIEHSIITRAVREIAAVQRRADHIAIYVAPKSWVAPVQGQL